MTVAELRLALEMLPDDLPVYIERPEFDQEHAEEGWHVTGYRPLHITTVSHEVDNAAVRLYLEDEAVVL